MEQELFIKLDRTEKHQRMMPTIRRLTPSEAVAMTIILILIIIASGLNH